MLKNDISKITIVTSIIVIQSSLDLDEIYEMKYTVKNVLCCYTVTSAGGENS